MYHVISTGRLSGEARADGAALRMPLTHPHPFLIRALVCAAAAGEMLAACKAGPEPAEALQPRAISTAQQRGASELDCAAAQAEVLSRETLAEPQGTGWYEPPHSARYTVAVAGCGKRTSYSVECDKGKRDCEVGPLTISAPPPQLADKLQPEALRTAQQRGATALGCPAATAEILKQETVEEAQATGWYNPPHRAVYTASVSGCGQATHFLVACDDRKMPCVAAQFQEHAEGAQAPAQLADQLQPDALQAAQQRGVTELQCPGVAAELVRKETIEEPQTTGWYEPPHRAVYTVSLAGCGQHAMYLVACDQRRKPCVAGKLQGGTNE
jgi:hypothetical protein